MSRNSSAAIKGVGVFLRAWEYLRAKLERGDERAETYLRLLAESEARRAARRSGLVSATEISRSVEQVRWAVTGRRSRIRAMVPMGREVPDT
jgi:hypothetical protein